MKEALFYRQTEAGKVRCVLCPHECVLAEGKYGNCNVRVNQNGRLYTENYGRISAMHLDPIEKKPLYHFFPGHQILSLGTVGCNLHCRFCQNDSISQVKPGTAQNLDFLSPEVAVAQAKMIKGNIGLAYTYNEPAIWFEYMVETASLAKKAGLYNVMVTNGFINPEPLRQLLEVIDAFSIDLKAFTDSFYRRLTSSSLGPVMETIKMVAAAGMHLELVNLVIPSENDDPEKFREMVIWIHENCGSEAVLHISKYFPRYRFFTEATPEGTLMRLYHIAREHLHYVYLGNVLGKGNDTTCPGCGANVILREGYSVTLPAIDKNGNCTRCSQKILKFI